MHQGVAYAHAACHLEDAWLDLVGGGWPKATDWKDEAARYDLNEIAINWNAGLIYALAGFIGEPAKAK